MDSGETERQTGERLLQFTHKIHLEITAKTAKDNFSLRESFSIRV